MAGVKHILVNTKICDSFILFVLFLYLLMYRVKRKVKTQ